MEDSKEGFEQNIALIIKGIHNFNTRKNSVFGKKILCTYSLNEQKGLK